MIARIWRGTVRTVDAQEYRAYVHRTGITNFRETEGNCGAWLLTRELGELTEVMTLSWWESENAIRAFAGDDISMARFYPEDARYLVDWGHVVEHFVIDEPLD